MGLLLGALRVTGPLPEQATFVIEGAAFEGHAVLEANHHCGESGGLNCATGVLCMPTYVLHNVRWRSAGHIANGAYILFQQEGPPSHPLHGVATMGGIFALSPPEEANAAGGFLPAGFCALCAGAYTYLLELDGGTTCVTADSLGLGALPRPVPNQPLALALNPSRARAAPGPWSNDGPRSDPPPAPSPRRTLPLWHPVPQAAARAEGVLPRPELLAAGGGVGA